MSPHYETAAHTLLFLCRSGLKVRAGVDHRAVVSRIAWLIDRRNERCADLSHAASADWFVDDLIRLHYIEFDANQRVRLLAILGTTIGNAEGPSRRMSV